MKFVARVNGIQTLLPIEAGAGGRVKIAFAFGDATPKEILPAEPGTTIFTAQIVIQTPFNGGGAALQLGDAAQSDRLINVDQNSPLEVGEYETNPGYTYSSAATILLTITPGEGCTQGSGFIVLEL